MCGITGFISQDRKSPLVIEGMCRALRHRGPDDQGFFMDTESGVYLGFNRLSVIDLSARARQPIFSEDKKTVAMVNGEIYNFRDLKNDLKNLGHVFRSESDSEAAVHAYEEWGPDFVMRLRGMFALAIFDKRKNEIFLARDPLGIKPLYYLKTKEMFAFASEAKAFLQIGPALYRPALNREAIDKLLLFPFIPDQSTALEGVQKVPPGTMLTFKNAEIRLKRYWALEKKEASRLPYDAACAAFEEKAERIVKSHLQSDVPVGVLLSGGVDSSFLAAVAAKVSREPITAFTASFDDASDESMNAAEVARHLGLKNISLKIDLNEAGRRVEDIIGSFDDLSCIDGGMMTNYLLAEKIRESGFKVVLNGEGADEIFGGYPWFSFGKFPFSALPGGVQNGILYRRISKNLTHSFSGRGREAFNELMGPSNEKDFFSRVSEFEICRQLPNNFLMKLDKATMAHGVETRVPYLDRELVEFVYNLPTSFKSASLISGNKRILRHIARRYLPARVADRKKRGFLFPVGKFLRNKEGLVREYVLSSDSLARKLLPLKQLQSLWGFRNIPVLSKEKEVLLWKLFILEVWNAKFLQKASSGADCQSGHQKANSYCVGV